MLIKEFLAAWCQFINTIDNQRLVNGFPPNEAQVCGLITGGCRTAIIRLRKFLMKPNEEV